MRSAYEGKVNARHIYLVSHLNSKIIRARETAFFRSAPLFGNPLPYGKGEFAALYNLCALRSAAKRGKPFGCPLKLTKKCADNSAHFFVNIILIRKSKNRVFCFFTQFAFAKACGKRVNFLPCYNSVCP